MVTQVHPNAHVDHIRLVQNFDWTNTQFGPLEAWPDQLRHLVRFMLSNPNSGGIYWGPDRNLIYNETFSTLIPELHPAGLGRPWRLDRDWWQPYEDICREVEATLEPVRRLEQKGPLLVYDGVLQETYHTIDYIPIFGHDGKVKGTYNHTIDVTKEVISSGRMAILLRMSNISATISTQDDLWNGTMDVFRDRPQDLPIAMVYSTTEDMSMSTMKSKNGKQSLGDIWTSKGSVGLAKNHQAFSDTIQLSSSKTLAPIIRAAIAGTGPMIFRKGDSLLPDSVLNDCTYQGHQCTSLVVCPLRLPSGLAVGCLVLVLQPIRPYNDDYQHFVRVLTRQIEDSLKLVVYLEAQARRLEDVVIKAAYEQEMLSKKLEQQTREARESELRFMNFAKQAPVSRRLFCTFRLTYLLIKDQVGVYVFGPEGEIQFCNDTWRTMIGMPDHVDLSVDVKYPWRQCIHPEDLISVDGEWQKLVSGLPQESFEFRVMRPSPTGNGQEETAYIRSSCFPEFAEDGSLRTVTGILIDLSLEMQNRRLINAKMEAALEAKRAQEYFMGKNKLSTVSCEDQCLVCIQRLANG